jgi:hypothetical protein
MVMKSENFSRLGYHEAKSRRDIATHQKTTPPGIIDPAARLFILPKLSSYLMKSISW